MTEFDRAMEFARSALAFLKKGQIPPFPHYYELLYTYAAGINPELNERFNTMLAENPKPSVDLADQLYDEFMRKSDIADHLSKMSTAMSEKISSVHEAIDATMESANAYSGSLESASDDLTASMDAKALKALTQRLLKETREMQATNKTLEARLNESWDDISALQRDLEEVRRESMLDALTKLSNRKSFDEFLSKSVQEARESRLPLSLVMVDIDHFKAFNDTHGHQTGDQVLRLVAMTLRANVKGRDMAARYGGEEFALVLPATGTDGAVRLAENIRKAIQSKELLKRSTNERLGRVTASFGIASWTSGDTPQSLIERADKCLYSAKAAGRNRVVNQTEKALLHSAA